MFLLCLLFLVVAALVLDFVRKKELRAVQILSLLDKDLRLARMGFNRWSHCIDIDSIDPVFQSADFVIMDGRKVIAVILVRSLFKPISIRLINHCKALGVDVVLLESPISCINMSDDAKKLIAGLRPGQRDTEGRVANILID